MQVRMLRRFRAYKPGQVLAKEFPRGAARVLIRRGIAEEIPDPLPECMSVDKPKRPKRRKG